MKKRAGWLAAAGLLLAAAAAWLLLSRSGGRAKTERMVFAMDTVMSLRLYGDSDDKTMDALAQLLQTLDTELSAVGGRGALAALNADGQSRDERVVTLTRRAEALSRRTGGALDLTLLPVSELWGFTGEALYIPADAELEALAAVTGMDRVTVTEDAVVLAPGTRLDFGAVAKGWAADLCRQRMEADGVSGILSLGGNLQTVGAKPDGSDWTVGIQAPDDPSANALLLTFSGSRAVVTSGDYQRCYLAHGVRYCHILDPETLRPVQNGLRSVTIVAEEGLLADALSTALFVLGPEAGERLWRESGDFEAIWIAGDGEIRITEGLEGLVSDCSYTVVKR